MRRFRRLPDALELGPGAREPGRERVRQVVIARDGEYRRPEGDEERVRALVLLAPAPIGEIARRHDQFRLRALDQLGKRRLDLPILVGARVEVADMQDVYAHGRMRL
jgi:hypothetical protein